MCLDGNDSVPFYVNKTSITLSKNRKSKQKHQIHANAVEDVISSKLCIASFYMQHSKAIKHTVIDTKSSLISLL